MSEVVLVSSPETDTFQSIPVSENMIESSAPLLLPMTGNESYKSRIYSFVELIWGILFFVRIRTLSVK